MLQKVNIIGTKYVHVFHKEGTNEILERETTKEGYYITTVVDPMWPKAPQGFKYVFSVTRKRFDTASGDLEDGQYAEYVTCFAKVAGKQPIQVEAEVIKAGIVDAEVPMRDDIAIVKKESL